MYDNGEIRTTYVSGSRDSSITLVFALALLAGFAGIVGAIFGAAVGYLFNSPHVVKFAAAGLALGLAAAFVFSFWKLFYLIEVWLKIDLNNDGRLGPTPTPQPEYLTSVYVNRDRHNESAGADIVAQLPTPKDYTLEHMAVILMREGREYFTQDNFTTGKRGTKLMNREQWNDKFLPQMIKARLARFKNGENNRGGAELTDSGWEMFQRMAGASVGNEYLEQLPQSVVYASDTIPHPTSGTGRVVKR